MVQASFLDILLSKAAHGRYKRGTTPCEHALVNYTFLTLIWRLRNVNVYTDELNSIRRRFSNTQKLRAKALRSI